MYQIILIDSTDRICKTFEFLNDDWVKYTKLDGKQCVIRSSLVNEIVAI